MANNYFRFKQFTVRQDGAAMKVGTDGVLLGAWAALTGNERRILDIGTGTGVIALMAAQTAPAARIDAVEIDPEAFRQAAANFQNSPWKDRLRVFPVSIQEFSERTEEKYDSILSNPPYFRNSLPSPDPLRTWARHSTELPYGELIGSVLRLLAPTGTFSVIYPGPEASLFQSLAAAVGLYCIRKTEVRTTEKKEPSRILMEFSTDRTETAANLLTIHTPDGGFTGEYIELTRDFYLKF